MNKLHHKKVVSKWLADHLPTTEKPPSDHLPTTSLWCSLFNICQVRFFCELSDHVSHEESLAMSLVTFATSFIESVVGSSGFPVAS